MLEAITAPFAHLGIRFIPTGGVSLDNMGDWLQLKSVAAVGGTWIARTDDIREGRFADIAKKAAAAVERAQGAALESRDVSRYAAGDAADALLHRRHHGQELDHEGVSRPGREHLGLDDAVIKGIDFPLHADPAAYREAVAFIKARPAVAAARWSPPTRSTCSRPARDLFDDDRPACRG